MKFAYLCKTKPASKGKKILVIGAGPAGLSATGYLVCQGFDVDIFDKLPLPGGLLIFGIPELRVDKKRVIAGAKELSEEFGVHYVLNTKVTCCTEDGHEGDEFVKKRVSFNELVNDYDATLIASGTWLSRHLRIPGNDLKGVYPALEFLIRINAQKLGLISEEEVPQLGKKVAIIGAGLTAIDTAYEVLSRGIHEIYLIYRRTKELAPAGPDEISKLITLGVKFMELVSPKIIIGHKGRVDGLELVKMKLGGPDRSGRPKPIPIQGSEFILEVDTIIYALGELPTPPCKDEGCCGIKFNKDGTIAVNEQYMTSREGIFAAGDVVSGPSLIGKAMASGLNAAKAIHKYLT